MALNATQLHKTGTASKQLYVFARKKLVEINDPAGEHMEIFNVAASIGFPEIVICHSRVTFHPAWSHRSRSRFVETSRPGRPILRKKSTGTGRPGNCERRSEKSPEGVRESTDKAVREVRPSRQRGHRFGR
jgi:hypothetical protein